MLGCSGGCQRGRGCLHIHCSRGGPPLIGWWQCVDCSDNNLGWAQSHENESNQTLNCKTLTTNETNVQIVSQHDQGVDPGEEEVVWIRGKLQATRQTQKNTISLLILVQQSIPCSTLQVGTDSNTLSPRGQSGPKNANIFRPIET